MDAGKNIYKTIGRAGLIPFTLSLYVVYVYLSNFEDKILDFIRGDEDFTWLVLFSFAFILFELFICVLSWMKSDFNRELTRVEAQISSLKTIHSNELSRITKEHEKKIGEKERMLGSEIKLRNSMITDVKKEYEKKIDEKNKEVEAEVKWRKLLIDDIKSSSEKLIKEKERAISVLYSLIKTTTPFKESAQMAKDIYSYIYDQSSSYLAHKTPPAAKAAEEVQRMKSIMSKEIEECNEMRYKYEFLLSTFPELKEYVEDDMATISLSRTDSFEDFKEARDRAKDYLSSEEWNALDVDDRNQLALDRYKKKNKSNWELGVEYEHYVGYLLREGRPPFNGNFHVTQFGELNGLADLGRDIIAEKVDLFGRKTIYVIQCKRWSEKKSIHENTICQLYGTAIEYMLRNKGLIEDDVVPVLVTTTELTKTAKEFAAYLKVLVYILPMGEYPMIKCNINGDEKIYHLPFDQQYHRTEIKNKGEFYAMTVKEATSKGFRRAKKYFTN